MAEFKLIDHFTSLGMTPELAAEVAGKITDSSVVEKIKSGYMAQSDYSRKMDELRTNQANSRRSSTRSGRHEQASIATYRGEYDSRYDKAAKERLDAQNALNAAKSAVEKLAIDYALPEDAVKSIFTGATPPPPPKRDVPDFDATKFMSVVDFQREANAYARLMPTMLQMEREHSKLFGADRLPDFEKLLDRAAKEKIPLKAAWESEYKVADKREEIRETAKKNEIAAAVSAAETRVRSEIALANPGVVGPRPVNLPHSPIFEHANGPGIRPNADGTMPTNYQRPTAGGTEDRVRAAAGKFWENYQSIQEGGKPA